MFVCCAVLAGQKAQTGVVLGWCLCTGDPDPVAAREAGSGGPLTAARSLLQGRSRGVAKQGLVRGGAVDLPVVAGEAPGMEEPPLRRHLGDRDPGRRVRCQ